MAVCLNLREGRSSHAGDEVTRLITQTLRIVQGRRQESAPPGAAVLTPPLRPAPQRAGDTLVMLLDLGERAPSRLCREAREAAALAFWTTSGSVIAALRRAAAAANRVLFRYNLRAAAEQRCYGALSFAAWTGEELFLVQSGPANAWALGEGALQAFPRADLPPLGAAATVEMRVAYLPIQPGDTLLLTSQELVRVISADAAQRVLALETTDAALDGLEQVAAGKDFTALLLRWTAEEAVAQPAPRRRRPKASPAPPPTPAPPPPAIPRPAPLPEPVELPTPVVAEETPPEPPAPVGREPEGLAEEGVVEPLEIPVWERPPEPVRRRVRVGLTERAGLGDRLRGVRAWLSNAGRRVGGGLTGAAAGTGRGLRTLFRRTLPGRDRRARVRPRPEPRPAPPENPRVMAGVAIGILVLVAMITLVVYVVYSGAVRDQQALHLARQEAGLAREAGDPAVQHEHWEAVLTAVASLEGNAEGAALQAEAQAALDRLDGVWRVEPVALRDFGTNAVVRRLVMRGTNLFILNAGSQEVEQLSLAEADSPLQPILRAGSDLQGQRVGPLIDLAWNTPAGRWSTDRLVVLDADNQVWVYDPGWPNNTYSLALQRPSGGTPVALAAFEGRLYLLDPTANQVWRYWPQDNAYPDPAEPYFSTEALPSLGTARDMLIDGSIYVLHTDGAVTKWREGGPAGFLVNGVPSPAPRFVALAVDTERRDGPVFLADSAEERIVALDANGNFRAQLRAAAGVFRDVQAMALDGTHRRLFLLAGGRLLSVDLSSPAMGALWEAQP